VLAGSLLLSMEQLQTHTHKKNTITPNKKKTTQYIRAQMFSKMPVRRDDTAECCVDVLW